MSVSLFVLFFITGSCACHKGFCEEDQTRLICTQARQVPVAISANVTILHVENSSLGTLQRDDIASPHLQAVIVRKSSVTFLRNGFVKSGNSLKALDLSFNIIQSLTSVFENLQLLQLLDLSSNRLEKLSPDCFEDLHNLVVLKLNRNRLKHVEMYLEQPKPKLWHLDLSRNDLKSFQLNSSSLRVLNVSNNALRSLNSFNLSFVDKIEILDLSNNTSIRQVQLDSFPKLKFLDIRFTNVSFELLKGLDISVVDDVKMDVDAILEKCVIAADFEGKLFNLGWKCWGENSAPVVILQKVLFISLLVYLSLAFLLCFSAVTGSVANELY